ncbi:hypothetical protein M9Y38_23675, partial [Escherichia coli]|nr:hypothetical protein [Escherichia coli]
NPSEILTLRYDYQRLGSLVSAYSRQKRISPLMAQILQWLVTNELFLHYNLILTMIRAGSNSTNDLFT